MTRLKRPSIVYALALAGALAASIPLHAQLGVGTYTRTEPQGAMTLTVAPCCNGGFRLTYVIGQTNMTMTVDSPMDGTEVPVIIAGKPSGETMAIKRLDAHHATTVLKMNGQPFGTSTSTLSPDGKTLTVVSDMVVEAPGQPKGRQTETWVRK
jgi:hypothetical protein